jgi:hypothetical protein
MEPGVKAAGSAVKPRTVLLVESAPGGENGEADDLRRREEQLVVLRVTDDGRGLPPGFSFENASSVGMSLQRLLAQQLRATVRIGADPAGDSDTHRGTVVEVHIADTIREVATPEEAGSGKAGSGGGIADTIDGG